MPEPVILVTDIPQGAVSDTVETVDQRTGARVFLKAYTPEELKTVMRDAPRAVGREPLMHGVRLGGIDPSHMRRIVGDGQRAGGSALTVGNETHTKTL